jgi:redox-sensitive bicupin YhaK (pirin superfamily)
VTHPLGDGRGVYLYVIEGDVTVNGESMATGDAAEIEGEREVAIAAASASELVLVDVQL